MRTHTHTRTPAVPPTAWIRDRWVGNSDAFPFNNVYTAPAAPLAHAHLWGVIEMNKPMQSRFSCTNSEGMGKQMSI